jgi:hypothetical protein
VLRNDHPDEFQVNSEVLMDDYVAKGDDLRPWDFGVRVAKLGSHSVESLAKQSQAVQDCALDQEIAEEGFPSAPGKLLEQIDLL